MSLGVYCHRDTHEVRTLTLNTCQAGTADLSITLHGLHIHVVGGAVNRNNCGSRQRRYRVDSPGNKNLITPPKANVDGLAVSTSSSKDKQEKELRVYEPKGGYFQRRTQHEAWGVIDTSSRPARMAWFLALFRRSRFIIPS